MCYAFGMPGEGNEWIETIGNCEKMLEEQKRISFKYNLFITAHIKYRLMHGGIEISSTI